MEVVEKEEEEGGSTAGVWGAALKVIPDIIPQWEREERGDGNHYYTLSKDEEGRL